MTEQYPEREPWSTIYGICKDAYDMETVRVYCMLDVLILSQMSRDQMCQSMLELVLLSMMKI